MTGVRSRGEKIRGFIINNVEKHPTDVAKVTADKFDITRQAVNKHLKKLVDEHALTQHGNTRNRSYRLHPLEQWQESYLVTNTLAEDVVWRQDVITSLGQIPENVLDIWHYGFTEMFNNALDHSDGSAITIQLKKTATSTELALYDDGIGIFKKIQAELDLLDERHAILELAKGKLTTDPDNHTGEGIFFTSRMFDDFEILSGGTYFSHKFGEKEDWILERDKFSSGTAVWMKLNNHTSRTTKKIFDKFTSKDDFGFTKTIVPVRLAQYGDDKLVSRSQAKRLLARVDRFKTVLFDFNGVDIIGIAFADEVFRVFALRHPEIELIPIKTNSAVKRVIHRAQSKLEP
jgi:anti-sigma regulatory factor (Ser/Thr protein kinase)/biotin operon repressor